jgi:hypothetical protein
MTICSEERKEWKMCLIECLPDPCPSSASEPEKFCFEVTVANEIITGKVYDKDDNFSYLSGICAPFDHQSNVSRMSFYFQGANNKGVPVKILLTGWGYEPEGANPYFVGGFVAVKPPEDPDSNKPSPKPVADSGAIVNFDPGDTGTGTGMQAACLNEPRT